MYACSSSGASVVVSILSATRSGTWASPTLSHVECRNACSTKRLQVQCKFRLPVKCPGLFAEVCACFRRFCLFWLTASLIDCRDIFSSPRCSKEGRQFWHFLFRLSPFKNLSLSTLKAVTLLPQRCPPSQILAHPA